MDTDRLLADRLPVAPGGSPVRRSIRFMLGHEPRELEAPDPTLTVLEYLRRHEFRAGTKEGCAEGDCGACTVVVGEPDATGMRYAAVNACIRFIPSLDGCQLLTVEDLGSTHEPPHPVQQAIIEEHGSQCGFCTPGFVMSLWALWRSRREPTPELVDDVLAGNLCRCTGYGTLASAAARLRPEAFAADRIVAGEGAAAAQLSRDGTLPSVGYEHGGRRCFVPRTSDELAGLLIQHPDATIIAGATDVGLWVTKQDRRLATVIFIGQITDLARIEDRGDHIRIGAVVTYSAAASTIAALYPDAGELVRRIGAVQVRNAGTIGGNIANGSPIGDTPPVLIAAGATLVLRRGDERRHLPLESFFLAYGRQDRQAGEFVEAVLVPKPAPSSHFWCWKISKRADQDISAVCGAFHLRLVDNLVAEARIAFGGMAATPKRAPAAEAALTGRPWGEQSVALAMQALAQDFAPLTDMRASAAYRLKVAQNLLRKCWLESSGELVRLAPPRIPSLV